MGLYTEITEIVAPSSAEAGETVPVTVKVKNLWTATLGIYVVGVLDSELRFIDWVVFWVPAGATYSYSGSFVMPNRDVTIHAYTYYEDFEGYMRLDDEASKDISLAIAPPEEYKGTLSRKELEYDETRGNIPVY